MKAVFNLSLSALAIETCLMRFFKLLSTAANGEGDPSGLITGTRFKDCFVGSRAFAKYSVLSRLSGHRQQSPFKASPSRYALMGWRVNLVFLLGKCGFARLNTAFCHEY